MCFTLKISLLFCVFAGCLYANDENRMNVISKSEWFLGGGAFTGVGTLDRR